MKRYLLLSILLILLLILITACSGETTAPDSTPQLTVNSIGAGQGTITSSPVGIACGLDCDHTYQKGITITLTAQPDKDSTFDSWSGACSGTASCAVAMNESKTATAKFGSNPLNFILPANLP